MQQDQQQEEGWEESQAFLISVEAGRFKEERDRSEPASPTIDLSVALREQDDAPWVEGSNKQLPVSKAAEAGLTPSTGDGGALGAAFLLIFGTSISLSLSTSQSSPHFLIYRSCCKQRYYARCVQVLVNLSIRCHRYRNPLCAHHHHIVSGVLSGMSKGWATLLKSRWYIQLAIIWALVSAMSNGTQVRSIIRKVEVNL